MSEKCVDCGKVLLSDDEYFQCEFCDNIVCADCIQDGLGHLLCSTCFNDNYFICPECGDTFIIEDGVICEICDEVVCPSCSAVCINCDRAVCTMCMSNNEICVDCANNKIDENSPISV